MKWKINSVSLELFFFFYSSSFCLLLCGAYKFWLRSFSERIRLLFSRCLLVSGSLIIRVLAAWQAMASVSSDSLPSLVPAFRTLSSSGSALRALIEKGMGGGTQSRLNSRKHFSNCKRLLRFIDLQRTAQCNSRLISLILCLLIFPMLY